MLSAFLKANRRIGVIHIKFPNTNYFMSNQEKVFGLLKKVYPQATYYLNYSNPLELMVGAILSAQCTDERVNKVTPAIFKKYKNAKDYANAKQVIFESEIRSTGFYRNKAKNIIAACRIIAEKHNGKIPSTMRELLELPGIARKTANVLLQNIYNRVEGIVVDTHVIRIAQRLGWTKQKDPEKIEQDLMKIFPQDHWKWIPHLLKSHGRVVCKAPTPDCSKCFLKGVCPKIGVTKKN